MERILRQEHLERYGAYLREEERSPGTIGKYLRELGEFYAWLPAGGRVSKETAVRWKERLEGRYEPGTVNGKLAALNGLFAFLGWGECRVKPLKRQREVFRSRTRELTREEYLRLLRAAREQGNERLYLVMETLCSTGMRVSELQWLTVEALSRGSAAVDCKGKRRTVLLTRRLRRVLGEYCRRAGRRSGPVFVTRKGRCLCRTAVTESIQKLAQDAQVAPEKCNPRCLRKLYCKTQKNIQSSFLQLMEQAYERLLETEQISIGWEGPGPDGR